MVYDYLPQQIFRPLLKNNGLFLHYETWKLPVSFYQVNRFFYNEVTACLEQRVDKRPIILLCKFNQRSGDSLQDPIHCVTELVQLLKMGRLYDQRNHNKSNMNATSKQGFDVWTLRIPLLSIKRRILNIQKRESVEIWEFNEAALQAYYVSSLSKLRQNPNVRIHVRYVVHDVLHINQATLKLRNRFSAFHHGHKIPIVFTVIVPGASPDDLSDSKGWVGGLRAPSGTEQELLNKHR